MNCAVLVQQSDLIMSDDKAIKDLEEVLALQKKAFLANQCPSIDERKTNIGKIPGMVLSNKDAIREALNQDFGSHPTAATDIVEILGVAGRAGYVISQLDKWMAHDSRDVDPQLFGGAKAEVRYQPKGVVGNIIRKINRSGYVFLLTYQHGIFHSIFLSDHCVRCLQPAIVSL